MVLILISGCSQKYKRSNNAGNEDGIDVVRVTEKQIYGAVYKAFEKYGDLFNRFKCRFRTTLKSRSSDSKSLLYVTL
jgi:hypothetical protein